MSAPALELANTFDGRQCSKQSDHILVPAGSADYNALVAAGYDCSLSLGYFYDLNTAPASGATPWANTCKLYRFSYDAGGTGAHLFTRGADNLGGMSCEPPARADVFTDFDALSLFQEDVEYASNPSPANRRRAPRGYCHRRLHGRSRWNQRV